MNWVSAPSTFNSTWQCGWACRTSDPSISRSATRPKAPCAIRSAVDIVKLLSRLPNKRDSPGLSRCYLMIASSLSACDQPRKGGFWIILQNLTEVNLLDALDVDALELHRLHRQRFGCVDSHLGADAVVGRRIELRALRARNDDEVAVGLETGRDRPFDFGFVIVFHGHIDHHDLLDVVVAAERAHDDVLRLALALLVDLDGKVVAAGAAAGQAHIADGGETPLQVLKKRRFARNTTKQEMLDTTPDNGVKNR